MDENARFAPRHRFAVLDGWRGVAALSVALYHCKVYSHIDASAFMQGTYLFVDFFFVLSGFVISYTYGNHLARWSDIVSFALRRFGRLWPLHVSVLLLLFGLELLKLYASRHGLVHFAETPFDPAGQHSWASLTPNILMLQAFDLNGGLTWNYPSWSIGAEFWCYLIFAALCWSGKRALPLGAAICILLGLVIVPLAGKGMMVTYELGFFRGLIGFFIGYFVYRVWQARSQRWARWMGWAEIPALAAIVLFLAATAETDYALAAPFLFAPVVLIFAHEQGIASRVLKAPLFERLGAWSYSIYMVHFFIVELGYWIATGVEKATHVAVRMHLPGNPDTPAFTIGHNLFLGDALIPIYALVVIGVSALTFRLIERPGRTYFNGIAGARRQTQERLAHPAA
jgi:hypothetical protein